MSEGASVPELEFALVEIMGHDRICGRISEVARFGVSMLQVDVPAVNGQPARTKQFGGAAIFSIERCTEEACLAAAAQLAPRPSILGLPSPTVGRDSFDDEDFDDEFDDEFDTDTEEDEEDDL